MYLFQHMIINIDKTKLNMCENMYANCVIKEIGFIVTNKDFEVSETYTIILKDSCEDIKNIENQLLKILKPVDILILFETTVTLNIFKNYLISNDMRKVLDIMNSKCFYDVRTNLKPIIKKINRFGVLNPTIQDLAMYVDFNEYIDREDASHTVKTIHECCEKLYRENKLNNFDKILKKNKEKTLVKNLSKIMSFQKY
jgi:hypothetical protein